jgi:hypothetical protein
LAGPKAFTVLRRYSQERNVKMRVLAEELASTRELPGLGRGQHADDDPGS